MVRGNLRVGPRTGAGNGRERAKEMTEQENWKSTDTDDAIAIANDEWQEVEAEVQIVVETEGDGWIGRYMGMDPRNANGIIQAHWTNVEFLTGEYLAKSAFANVTRDLENKLKKVPVKSLTRVQWVSSMDTGHESGNPMRVFRVQWK
jgi:hypothetical protein